MLLAVKANKEYKITEKERKDYESRGFKIIEPKRKESTVKKQGGKTGSK